MLRYGWFVVLTMGAASMMLLGGCVKLKVLDDVTGLPIPDAEITCTCFSVEGATALGKTNQKGELTFLEPEGMDMLHVTKSGYEPWERNHVWLVQNTTEVWGPVIVKLIPMKNK